MDSSDSVLLVHLTTHGATTHRYQSYDLYPLYHVFNLRRLIAEDYRLMEERIYLLREGQVLSDNDCLQHNDLVTAILSSP